MRLLSSRGETVTIGKELARGGEGAVHLIDGIPNRVAKIYLKKVTPQLDKKLRFMVQHPSSLGRDASIAWPSDLLLEEGSRRELVGFIMPRLDERSPVHSVYSPAHRLQDHPDRTWDFLLLTARNVAASVASVHSLGHVIGDVNQNGFLIDSSGRAALIDCDSFQIRSGTNLFMCRVGVPEFTAPELQAVKTFEGIVRTSNHDNFGLAVLIFQLLLGGRHPFSGIPVSPDAGDEMGSDIRAFRFAEAPDNKRRGLIPPPRAVPSSLLPPQTRDMFVRAFTERGVASRPSASEWVGELERLSKLVKRCSHNARHVYLAGSGACTWCDLEGKGLRYFVQPASASGSTFGSTLDIAQIWKSIQAVEIPRLPDVPDTSAIPVQPNPRPRGVAPMAVRVALRGVTIAIGAAVSLASSPQWWLGIGVALALLLPIAVCEAPLRRERKERNLRLKECEQHFDRLLKERGHLLDSVQATQKSLMQTYSKINDSSRQESSLADSERINARQRALERYLRKCYIDAVRLQGVGPAKKTALASFGIETAADVTESSVRQVHGFGEQLTQRLLNWRKDCEIRFVFNPQDPSVIQDLLRLREQRRRYRQGLGQELLAGQTKLKSEVAKSKFLIAKSQGSLQKGAHDLAQARADKRAL